jgi:hypothetical protein
VPGIRESVINRLAQRLKHNPGYIAKMADELPVNYSLRNLSSIAFRFIIYFIHSVLYLMLEIGQLDENSLLKQIQIKGIEFKPSDYLLKHITSDISKISELLKSNEYYIFMHVIFNQFVEMVNDSSFDSNNNRETFENNLTLIISPKLDRFMDEISSYKSLFVGNKLDYMNILNENYSDNDFKMLANSELYRIFRLTRTGSWDDLRTEFMKMKPNFHFLKLLIEKFEDIKLLSNLYPIITFTNYMLNLCNYKYSRNEAKEIKIKDVIEGNLTAENLFIEFAEAYKKISYKATQWQCKDLPQLQRLTIDMPLSFILL